MFKNRGLAVCQKLLLSVTEDISSLAKWSFFTFRKRKQQKFRCFLCYFREVSVLLCKNYSPERFIIAWRRSFVMNLLWLALRYFFCKGVCLLKTSVNKFGKWCILYYLNHILRSRCQVCSKYNRFENSDILYKYHLGFLFWKVLFKDCNCKFAKIGKFCFCFENSWGSSLEPDLYLKDFQDF